MNFDEVFNVQMLLMALAIAALTVPIKAVGDYYFNKFSAWSHLVLPLLSLAVGLVLGFIFHNVMGGLVASLFSQFIYTKVQDYIKNK